MKRETGIKGASVKDLTDAEWAIMRVVWEREACTAGDVQEALMEQRGWAYSTVKTTMDRMVRKGILQRRRLRNLQLFSSRLSRTEVAGREVRRLLDRAFDGAVAPMVNHLVTNENLTREDIDALRQMIKRAEPEKASLRNTAAEPEE